MQPFTHPAHPLPVLGSRICSGPASPSDGSLQDPPRSPHSSRASVGPPFCACVGWQAWGCRAQPSPLAAWLPLSVHPAASHLVSRNQACSQPSWEAEVIGSIIISSISTFRMSGSAQSIPRFCQAAGLACASLVLGTMAGAEGMARGDLCPGQAGHRVRRSSCPQ